MHVSLSAAQFQLPRDVSTPQEVMRTQLDQAQSAVDPRNDSASSCLVSDALRLAGPMHPDFRPAQPVPQFAADVRGPESKESHLEMAAMAQAVYGSSQPPEGWREVSDGELTALGVDPAMLEGRSGLEAAVYTSEQGDFVLAFKGTDITSIVDWATNVLQGAGGDAAQYRQAVQLAQALDSALPDGALSITGHSLGGGLAAAAASVVDVPAVTFNASGVHENTLRRELGLATDAAIREADAGGVVNYVVDGDPLTAAQKGIPGMREAMGTTYTLEDPNPGDWNPFNGIENPFEDHNMDTVIKGMETDRPWAH